MKKQKRFTKLFAAILAIGMMMAAPAAVYADPEPTVSGGTESEPAQLVIWGRLKMPEGTTTPAGTLTFTFTKVSVDGGTTGLSDMPVIADKTVTFAATDTGSTANGIKVVSHSTENIVAGLSFPHAGEYVYSVKENASGFTLADTTDLHETMDYSTQQYQIQFLVANGTNGTYVKSVSVNQLDTSGGTTVVGAKIPDDTDGDEGTHFSFDNKFNRIHLNDPENPNDPDPDDPDNNDTNLRISKNVSGDNADQTKYFGFSVKLTAPAVVTGTAPTEYHAVIMENNAAITPTTANGNLGTIADDKSFAITIGSDFSFNLKHGQTLVILDAPVGAKYTATETTVTGYTASYVQTVNGTANTSASTLPVPETLIGEDNNDLAFTNSFEDITPTGIVINNMPYVLMGCAAAGLLVILMRRNRKTA